MRDSSLGCRLVPLVFAWLLVVAGSPAVFAQTRPRSDAEQKLLELLKGLGRNTGTAVGTSSETGRGTGSATDGSTRPFRGFRPSPSIPSVPRSPESMKARASSGNMDASSAIDGVQQLPAGSVLKPEEMAIVLKGASTIDSRPNRSLGPEVAESALTTEEIDQMRSLFLLEFDQHAKFVAANQYDKALRIAAKWQYCGTVYPKRIEEITNHLAGSSGFADFGAWIAEVVRRDLKSLNEK